MTPSIQECQRQYLEAIGYQGIQKPDVAAIASLSPAIKITPWAYIKNPRSSVGTVPDIYTDLRMVYEKLSKRTCPSCGHKMDKLTWTYFYANTREGACENCHGLGEVLSINEKNVLDSSRSLENGGMVPQFQAYFETTVCPVCHGERLGELSRRATVAETRIPEQVVLSLDELYHWIIALEKSLSASRRNLVGPYLLDLKTKIRRIVNFGLGYLSYLSLNRQTMPLSGGEGQRLKLGIELVTGAGKQQLYLIDEPTTGLHPLDVETFLVLLNRIVDAGNTVIVVEHNQQVISASDWIIDLGPEGGIRGGQVVAAGTLPEIIANEKLVTGKYLGKYI